MFCTDVFRYARFSRRMFTLSGIAHHGDGVPSPDLAIAYYINGERLEATSDSGGRYYIRVREGDHVRIAPSADGDSCCEPARRVICCASGDMWDLDFEIGADARA